MKKVLLVIYLFIALITVIKANVLSLNVIPKRPVQGEIFKIIFSIETKSSEEPEISFKVSDGLNILSKSSQGISIQTVIVNNQFTSKRKISYVYEVSADNPGSQKITQIKVKLGDNILSSKDLDILVLQEQSKQKKLFIKAFASKDTSYVGEGIDVRYYLYSRVPTGVPGVEKYPRLQNMIKKFHDVNIKPEKGRVNYRGVIYSRSLIYSARVFPEKVGTATIDSLKLRIEYQDINFSQSRRRFGSGFGFGFGNVKQRSIHSEPVKIAVLPLPKDGVPPSFAGLVGVHKFDLDQLKNKFLVNEAIEIKLKVVGVGALEKMYSPVIYQNNRLEDFDVKSEIVDLDGIKRQKVFDYTYLARGPFVETPSVLKMSYFDPDRKKYVEEEIHLSGLNIRGGAATLSNLSVNKVDDKLSTEINTDQGRSNYVNNNKLPKRELVAPIFDLKSDDTLKHKKNTILNFFLFLVVVIQIFEISYRRKLFPWQIKTAAEEMYRDIVKNGLSYSRLYVLINLLDKEQTDLAIILDKSCLSADAKNYFKSLVNSLERGTYHDGQLEMFGVKQKYFKEVLTELKNEKV